MTSSVLPGRGRLRTYLGIAPGVGKTYAMLRDARARRRSGVDAVVAYRERHGRSATAAQLAGLEVLPARSVSYRGASFTELDVAAVLDRRPERTGEDVVGGAGPFGGPPGQHRRAGAREDVLDERRLPRAALAGDQDDRRPGSLSRGQGPAEDGALRVASY